MAGYKKDQGRLARMAVFWTFTALCFHGCDALRAELAGRWGGVLGRPVLEQFPRLPVLAIDLTPAFLIAAVLFAGGVLLLYRYIERPKNADLLIETESELRKVTWPTVKEVLNSSVVVIISVLFLMAFLAGADLFLARLAGVILFGGS